MLASGTAEEPLAIDSIKQESSPNSPKLGKGPVTPELGQAADRSRFGLPTPDTTPESLRVVPGVRRKPVFTHPGSRRDIGPATPSASSRDSSTEEIEDNRDHDSRQSIHTEVREETPEEPSLSSTPPPYPYEEENTDSSVSVIKSIFDSVLSFLNLAKQRRSRADDARVRDTIALIKALPTIKRTRVGNVTRTLTAKQYGEFLRVIEDLDGDEELRPHLDGLRFDYTRSKKRLEIRMPTTMHGGLEDFVKEKTFRWKGKLEDSQDSKISNAAKTILPSANANIAFSYSRGPSDTKSPDWRIGHKMCERRCTHPTLIMEFGWTQEKKALQAKADAYMRRTKGEIRTVVGILMREMYLAENKNEKRLERMYLEDELDINEPYSYWEDEMNETGEASILVWRRKIQRNGTVKAECYQDEVFRDKSGNPVDSVSLRLPVQDFICEGIANSSAGRFQAPDLEISSEDLCESINDNLTRYRQERGEVVRDKAKKEKEERRQKAEQEAQRNASRGRQARTRGAGTRASERNEDQGRIMAYGRLVSARLRGQKA
ncbi:hypothetical protein F4860DRAFT_420543 [Xylaria cubensis]|nr:hypothetical protein F4860DRAFT_420543 [Xylaria cubensis]